MRIKYENTLLRALENVLFVLGFASLIPAFPSEPDVVYAVWPGLIWGLVFFGMSLFLAFRRKAENAFSIVFKLAFLVVYACILHMRIFGVW
jgi:FtsH-binding integral membrane protein